MKHPPNIKGQLLLIQSMSKIIIALKSNNSHLEILLYKNYVMKTSIKVNSSVIV